MQPGSVASPPNRGQEVAQSAQLEEVKRLVQELTQLDKEGKYNAAIPVAERILTIQEQALGPEHPAVAIILNGLGLLYYNQGNYSKAEPLYQRAIAIAEKALGCQPAI